MKISIKKLSKTFGGLGFISPALILILIFGLIPLFLAVWISLFNFPLLAPSRRIFVGLENYVRAFQNAELRIAFFNTLYYALWQVPIQTGLALLLAVLISKPMRAIGFFRTGFYLPTVISMVVASTMWMIMLDSQNGLINAFLMRFGLPRQPFLSSTKQALPSLAMMLSWKWVGFSMVIFLAGLHSIPDSLYEAARIDGATSWRSFWYITLPLLRRPAIYILITNTINAMKLFTPIYVITQGGPQNSTLSMIYYIYREAFTYGRLGNASAIASIYTAFLIILAIFQLRLMRSADVD